jgi:hypothetical protein
MASCSASRSSIEIFGSIYKADSRQTMNRSTHRVRSPFATATRLALAVTVSFVGLASVQPSQARVVILPAWSPEQETATQSLTNLFGVDVRLEAGVLRRALRRHTFAAKRHEAGDSAMIFGRAHVKTDELTEAFTATIDRAVLMTVESASTLTPFPGARDMKRFTKAQATGRTFEAKLPCDRR